jgi:hypothetical protein
MPIPWRMNAYQMVPFNLVLFGLRGFVATGVGECHFRSIGIGYPVYWLSRQL